MECIRVTGLTSFYTCAYKYKNEPYEPNPANTFHWDVVNISVNSKWSVQKFIDFRSSNLQWSISLKYNLEIITWKATKLIDELYSKYTNVYQEAKMYWKRGEDLWLEWTPDVIYFNEWETINVLDWKCSTHSWYSGDEMWDLNLQTYIYPFFVMKYFDTKEVIFSYVIFDKNTSKVKKESRTRTLEECEAKIKEAVDMYTEAQLVEEWKPKENKLCMFCSLKKAGKCPLFGGRKVEQVEEDLFL